GNPQHALKDKGVIDIGCSRHMTGNMSYLFNFEELNGGYVAFAGNPRVMCDKKNSVLFTDTECLVLSSESKMPNENQVLLRVSRENNMYNVDLKNIGPFGYLTCLFGKATLDEFNLWHRRLGHINFKTMNKLVKGNLVRGLPSKVFENDNTCVACKKGKQHRASCTTKPNRVLVTKPQNKALCELLHGRTPSISFMRPFGCPMTILNTLDSLGKFDGKVDDGFLGRYSVSSKAFRVFNSRTRIIQETLHAINLTLVQVSKNNLMQKKQGRKLSNNMCFFPAWSSSSINPYNTDGDVIFDEKEHEFEGRKPESEVNVSPSSSAQSKKHDDKTKREAKGKSLVESFTRYRNLSAEFEDFFDNSINEDNAAGTLVPAVGKISTKSTTTFSAAGPANAAASPTHGKSSCIDTSQYPDDPNMLELEDITYTDDEDDVGAEANFNNLETSITEELLQFKMQKVWVLVDFLHGKRAIGTKWVFRNKKDERGIVVRNKARLVTQGHTQEEGIDYEEVFAPVVKIEAIRLFLAYASFMGFMVYQMDDKSAFLYGTIEEEVVLSGMESLKRMLHVPNILSAGYLTIP
nr:ribonuclease H-like domain-containing protein [Tanacetum cinerariifolium]